MRSSIAGVVFLGACAPGPGTLYGPEGIEPLRTALFTQSNQDGELVLVLSNGELSCSLLGASDWSVGSAASAQLYTAACREGARHVVLSLYDIESRWVGRYPGFPDEGGSEPPVELLGPSLPRAASGASYAVIEAQLFQQDGLLRGYTSVESETTALAPDGGVDLAVEGSVAEGSFELGGEGLGGEFRAERCTGDTSLVQVAAATGPLDLCLAAR